MPLTADAWNGGGKAAALVTDAFATKILAGEARDLVLAFEQACRGRRCHIETFVPKLGAVKRRNVRGGGPMAAGPIGVTVAASILRS